MASLLGRHMKDGRGLARVVDDNVVDIIVVYDVRDVPARALRSLNSVLLLRVPRRRPSTAHAEALAVRDSLTFKSALVLALLRHRVLSELLTAPKRSLLIVSVAVDEIVILFLTRLGCVRLLCVVRAEDASVAVAHVALPGQFSLGLGHCRVIFKIRL